MPSPGTTSTLNISLLPLDLQHGYSVLGEYELSLGTIGGGTNYLQILREDHGGYTGYDIEMTGDARSTPVPVPVPVLATLALLGVGLLGVGATARRRTATR
jgi:hypothetical protein